MVKNLEQHTKERLKAFDDRITAANTFEKKQIECYRTIAKALIILADKIGKKIR